MALLSENTRVFYAALLSASILCIYLGKVAHDSTTQEHSTPMKLSSSILSSGEIQKKMIVSSNRAVESETSLSSSYFLHGAGVSQEDERENRGGGSGNDGGLGFDLWIVDKQHRHPDSIRDEEEAKRDGGGIFSASGGKTDASEAKEKDMDTMDTTSSNITKNKKQEMTKKDTMFDNIISSWILKANSSHGRHRDDSNEKDGNGKVNLKVESAAKYFRNLIDTSKKEARVEGGDVSVARYLREEVATSSSFHHQERKKNISNNNKKDHQTNKKKKYILEKSDPPHHRDSNIDVDGTSYSRRSLNDTTDELNTQFGVANSSQLSDQIYVDVAAIGTESLLGFVDYKFLRDSLWILIAIALSYPILHKMLVKFFPSYRNLPQEKQTTVLQHCFEALFFTVTLPFSTFHFLSFNFGVFESMEDISKSIIHTKSLSLMMLALIIIYLIEISMRFQDLNLFVLFHHLVSVGAGMSVLYFPTAAFFKAAIIFVYFTWFEVILFYGLAMNRLYPNHKVTPRLLMIGIHLFGFTRVVQVVWFIATFVGSWQDHILWQAIVQCCIMFIIFVTQTYALKIHVDIWRRCVQKQQRCGHGESDIETSHTESN